MQDISAGRRSRPNSSQILAALGWILAAGLQLTVGWFTLTAIGLISVPPWAMAVLVGLWLAATVLLVTVARRRPLVAPLVPLGNALLLWGAVAAGEMLLGWTA